MILLTFIYQTLVRTEFVTPNTPVTLVARFICSIMMHLQVEPEVRNGQVMMKFAANHPKEFDQPSLAWLVGLLQLSAGILCEVACMLYLSTIESTMDVIIKFIALGKIAMIDDMYAAAMPKENKLKRNVRDLLGKEDGGTGEATILTWKHYRRWYKLSDDRTCWIVTLSRITKCIRILYASMIFYFLPFWTLNPYLLGTNPSTMEFAPDLTTSICQYLGYVEPDKLGMLTDPYHTRANI